MNMKLEVLIVPVSDIAASRQLLARGRRHPPRQAPAPSRPSSSEVFEAITKCQGSTPRWLESPARLTLLLELAPASPSVGGLGIWSFGKNRTVAPGFTNSDATPASTPSTLIRCAPLPKRQQTARLPASTTVTRVKSPRRRCSASFSPSASPIS